MKNKKIILLLSCLFLLFFNSQFHPGSRFTNHGSRIQQSAINPEHSGQSAILAPGSWNRIEFASTSTNSRMSWCKIEYANFGVYCNGASPELNHLIVRNCSDTGICFSSIPSILHPLSFILAEDNRVGLQFEGCGLAPLDKGGFLMAEEMKRKAAPRNATEGYSNLISNGVMGLIERNVVIGNDEVGIGCNNSSVRISNNQIKGNITGIFCHGNSHYTIDHNEILGL